MKQSLTVLIIVSIFYSCESDNEESIIPENPVGKETNKKPRETWSFIMAGQSNMAGRGVIENQDTITNKRILSIDILGNQILAKEPIHFYEPSFSGLDCGISFANTLINNLPENIDVLLIPTAIGGATIEKWIDNANHRNYFLYDNFEEKVLIAKKLGTIKGIIWHQGETNIDKNSLTSYNENLKTLFLKFRETVGNDNLPIIIGEVGSFLNGDGWKEINIIMRDYSLSDINSRVVKTTDFTHKGDNLHFDSKSLREMGRRYAFKILELIE